MISIKKIIAIIIILVLILVIFEVVKTWSNPLSRSEVQLRKNLLVETPVGTPMNEVEQFIRSKKDWEIEYIDKDNGFTPPTKTSKVKIGVKSIRVFIGQYSSISDLYFITSVTVFYGFNERSELVDIWVWKDTDTI